jgi:hypothetical protein
MAERELQRVIPNWDMISKLDGILSDGIPDKVWAIKKQAGVGRAREREQAETLEQEAKRFAERMQSLVARAKGLETFAQEHAVRCAYEERELEDSKRQAVFSNSPRRLVRGEELLPHRPTFASPGNLRRSSLTVQLSSRNEREARPYPFRAIEIDRENN